jgi:gluconolactonase
VLARRNSERFKGPNDLVFARNGDLYFTDQGQTGLHDPTGACTGCARRPARLPARQRPSPNGLALSPDEEVLFVAMTRDNAVWRLPLLPDGSTAKVGRFASSTAPAGRTGWRWTRPATCWWRTPRWAACSCSLRRASL